MCPVHLENPVDRQVQEFHQSPWVLASCGRHGLVVLLLLEGQALLASLVARDVLEDPVDLARDTDCP